MLARYARCAVFLAFVALAPAACESAGHPTQSSGTPPSGGNRPAAGAPAWCSTLADDANLLGLATDVPALVNGDSPAPDVKSRVLAAATTLNSAAGLAGSDTADAMRRTSDALIAAAADPSPQDLTAAGDALTTLGKQVQTECHYS